MKGVGGATGGCFELSLLHSLPHDAAAVLNAADQPYSPCLRHLILSSAWLLAMGIVLGEMITKRVIFDNEITDLTNSISSNAGLFSCPSPTSGRTIAEAQITKTESSHYACLRSIGR